LEQIKILVTGANGFLGSNFCKFFSDNSKYLLYKYDKNSTDEELQQYAKDCDVVFHFAGVIKSKKEKDFYTGNVGLTKKILKNLIKNKKHVKFVFMSSIWVEKNPSSLYGKTKLIAGDLIKNVASKINIKPYIYRLTNIFGEGALPGYGGVVPNFCYNAIHDLPLTINDANTEVNFVYVKDLMSKFKDLIEKEATIINGICELPKQYKITIGELAEIIKGFKSKAIKKNNEYRQHSYRKNQSAHGRRTRFFEMSLRPLGANGLANMQAP